MKILQVACILIAAAAATAVAYPFLEGEPWHATEALMLPPQGHAQEQAQLQTQVQGADTAREPAAGSDAALALVHIVTTSSITAPEQRQPDVAAPTKDQARLEEDAPSWEDRYPVPERTTENLSYLADYAFSEVPPDRKPADVVLDSFKDIPLGTPVEEIQRASEAFGLDPTFMEAVAKIESDFDPKQRTGSYIGLFQLSNYEFQRYGSGDILNARDNAIAASDKFATAALLFELETHKKATVNDLYLIHQQGTQGAAEHVSHPERVAWQSMCATDEGRQRGEKWCKRAIWGNTLPEVKQAWKSVDKLTSGAFVQMWRERLAHFYSRYAQAIADK
jgi:hypothetical protein